MTYIITFLIFAFSFASVFAEQYYLAICAIFQDEAPYMKEWLDFHLKQGVEHFYLYNNLSKDNFQSVLKPYIKKKLVTLEEWPYDYCDVYEWTRIQCDAYMTCVRMHEQECKWIAFIDLDEFLFCPDKIPLPERLKYCESYPAMVANWVMYGTSNVMYADSILKDLVFRAALDNPINKHVKTIAQPKEITGCTNPHFFTYFANRKAANELGILVPGPFCPVFSAEQFRINHYWSRDLKYFYNQKLPRRERIGCSNAEAINMEKEYNLEFDPILAD